jgi:(E)-4-hydroxy-3-methylbut-2-enyl-diphosphate synthase
VREVIKAAKDHGCSIRIGVNAGSLEKHLLEKYGEPCPEAMVESGLEHSASCRTTTSTSSRSA